MNSKKRLRILLKIKIKLLLDPETMIFQSQISKEVEEEVAQVRIDFNLKIESFSIKIREISKIEIHIKEEKKESIMTTSKIISNSKISLTNFKIKNSIIIRKINSKILIKIDLNLLEDRIESNSIKTKMKIRYRISIKKS